MKESKWEIGDKVKILLKKHTSILECNGTITNVLQRDDSWVYKIKWNEIPDLKKWEIPFFNILVWIRGQYYEEDCIFTDKQLDRENSLQKLGL